MSEIKPAAQPESKEKPAVPPEFVDVYPTEGRRVRIETGELLPFGHVLRGVRRSTFYLRLERDGDVALKPHEPEVPTEAAPSSPPAGDLPAGDPPTADTPAGDPPGGGQPPSGDAGGGRSRKS